jgi:hypothetical protein
MSEHQDIDLAGERVYEALELASKITYCKKSHEDTRDIARMILWEARKGSPQDVPENEGHDQEYDELMETEW